MPEGVDVALKLAAILDLLVPTETKVLYLLTTRIFVEMRSQKKGMFWQY
jgi:hypothetical protein